MRAIALALLVLLLAVAGPAPASAEYPVYVAAEPPPDPPDPPRHATVAMGSGGMSFASDRDTRLERFGSTVGLGMAHLTHREDGPGFELVGAGTGGSRGRSYSLASRIVVGPRLRRGDGVRPFFAFGLAFAISRLDEDGSKAADSGLGIGPSAALGLHGFVTHRLYWRAGAGFVGAGVGTLSTDLGFGWVIGK
jgi:hypothetical protein